MHTKLWIRATLLAAVSSLCASHALAQTATTTTPVLSFTPAAVGIAPGSAQTLTATFTVAGYSGTFTPTASLHYASSYTITAGPTCTGGGAPETCTVTVRFVPTYPGARKDAIFLTNGTTRLATVLLGGVGNAPFGALQNGVLTTPAAISTLGTGHYSAPAVDENHNIYFFYNNNLYKSNYLSTPTLLVTNATNGDQFDMAIDGAGVLYWGIGNQAGVHTTINTYDTVQNVSGTITMPASDLYYAVATDGIGDVFGVGANNGAIYKVPPTGSATTTTINPAITAPYHAATDAAGDLFVGAGTINELTTGGTQSQVSAIAASEGLGTDPAGTLYATNPSGVTVELAPSNYAAVAYTYSSLAATVSYGNVIGNDGTIYFATAGGIDVIDRSQNPLAFPSQAVNVATTQTVNVINIGNQPLTYTSIAISGTGFSLSTASTAPCTPGIVLAAGASCNVSVTFNAPNPGAYTGSVVLTSNSLNNAASTQTIPLTAYIHGPYITANPNPLVFPNQTMGTTSSIRYVTITNTGYDNTTGLTFSSSNPAFAVVTSNINSSCTTSTTLQSAGQPYNFCQLPVTFNPALAQSYTGTITVTGTGGIYANSVVTINVSGTGAPVVTQTAGGTGSTLVFNNAAVGVAQASAQTITASFLITGETTLVSPTASMHYGTSYTAGTATCVGSIGAQTCSVPVTFRPIYPGGRKDALFLTAGGVRVATALVYGVGTAPFALIQPGVITDPAVPGGNYYYGSIVDENGTVYTLETGNNAVLALTKAGVATTLPITEIYSPREIAIDGAGVLYIADQQSHGLITTYDTVQGIQGSVPYSPSETGYNQGVAIGNTGNIYLTDSTNIYQIPLSGPGTTKTTAINPGVTQAYDLLVDSAEDVLIASNGYQVNLLTPGGTQTQVATSTGNGGVGIDGANTIYSGRYGTGSVGELPASNYSTVVGYIGTGGPLGLSVGPDGTVYEGDYTNIDKIDRSQGFFTFNALNLTQTATPQTASIYNGGNTNLTISSVTLTGDTSDYTITANTCTNGATVLPGAICTFTVNFTAPGHGGIFTGNVAIISNSLNTSTTNNLGLSDTVAYPYITVSPTSLAFTSIPEGTTSQAQTVTFTNMGQAVGVISAANIAVGGTITNQFAITLSSACSSVAIGGNCTGSVVYKPNVTTAITATGNAYINSGSPNPVTFTVTGAGGTPVAPAITFSPASIAFGNQQYNASGTITSPPIVVQVTNSGNAALTFTGFYNTGANSSVFNLITDPNNPCTSTTTLAAGTSCNVAIDFQPYNSGAVSTMLTVYDNVTGSPQNVSVTGTGVQTPEAQFSSPLLTAIAGVAPVTANGTGDGGPATAATFNQPFGVTQDQSGNIYVSDYGANYVRKIAPNGTITQYAGVVGYGTHGFSGDTGPATAAELNSPTGLAVDAQGNLYIADEYNGRVRVVNAATGIISTYAGSGVGPYVNGATAAAAKFPGPVGLAFDPSGNLYVAMGQNSSIVVKVTPFGVTSLFAGVLNGSASVNAYNGDNQLATSADLNSPYGVASDLLGNVYIADYANLRVRKVTASNGMISTIAGNGTFSSTGDGAAATAATVIPYNVAVNLAGDVFIEGPTSSAQTSFTVRKITSNGNGIINTVAGGGAGGLGASATSANINYPMQDIAIDNNGDLLIVTNQPNQVLSSGPSGFIQFPSTTVNTTSSPITITFENTGSGNLSLASTFPITGPFSILGGSCPNNLLAPGSNGTCNLAVAFTPTAAAAQTGAITVPSNDALTTQTIYLQGTGTAAAAPTATFSTPQLTFPNTTDGTTSGVMTFTLTNTGTAALTITNIAVTGANSTNFTQTNNCTSPLAVNALCTFSVTFSPMLPLLNTAAVSVTDNATGSPQSVALQGLGIAAVLPTLTPNTLAFANTPVNSSTASQMLTFTNNGVTTLTGVAVSLTGANPTDFAQTNTCGATLAAGANCTIAVTFVPLSAATFGATISVANSSGTLTSSLTGTGTAPQASLSAVALTFTATTSTVAYNQSVSLTNTGTATLNVSSVAITGTNPTAFTTLTSPTNPCGNTLAAGASCNLTVGLTSSTVGTYSATLVVTDNASPTSQSVALSGTVTGIATPVFAPVSLNFTGTPINTTATAQTLTFTNNGTGTLTGIGAVSITGTNPTNFAQTNNCGATLAAGANCTINVTFTPASATLYAASVSITDSLGTQLANLSGTGTAAAQVSLTPLTYTFASTTINTTSATQVFTLSNPGTATLTGIAVALAGTNPADFAETTTCGTTLAAGANCTISVTFTPLSVATFGATLSVANSVATQTATLSGSGTAVPVGVVTFNPTTYTFPTTTIGSTATEVITLSNTGNATITGIGLSLTGTNPTSFAETSTCGTTLAAAGSCAITVVFTPAAASTYTANLSLADNLGTQTVALTGTGTAVVATSFGIQANTPSAAVDPGGIATFNIDVTTLTGNFTTPVVLTVSGLPTGAIASFNPSSVVPGTTGAISVLSIQTAASFALSKPVARPFSLPTHLPAYAALLLLPLAGTRRFRRKLRELPASGQLLARLLTLLLLSLAAILPLTGCSGGYFGASPQSYTITVTGTSGAVSHSTTVTLTIQ